MTTTKKRGGWWIKGRSPKQRFYAKVAVPQTADGCWLWTAGVSSEGYGKFYMGKREWKAHRASYTLLIGEIPDGLTLDHLCKNTSCVNPEHLEPVTVGVNTLRGGSFSAENARKTSCPQGHEYTIRSGERICKPCQAANAVRYKTRKKAAR